MIPPLLRIGKGKGGGAQSPERRNDVGQPKKESMEGLRRKRGAEGRRRESDSRGRETRVGRILTKKGLI